MPKFNWLSFLLIGTAGIIGCQTGSEYNLEQIAPANTVYLINIRPTQIFNKISSSEFSEFGGAEANEVVRWLRAGAIPIPNRIQTAVWVRPGVTASKDNELGNKDMIMLFFVRFDSVAEATEAEQALESLAMELEVPIRVDSKAPPTIHSFPINDSYRVFTAVCDNFILGCTDKTALIESFQIAQHRRVNSVDLVNEYKAVRSADKYSDADVYFRLRPMMNLGIADSSYLKVSGEQMIELMGFDGIYMSANISSLDKHEQEAEASLRLTSGDAAIYAPLFQGADRRFYPPDRLLSFSESIGLICIRPYGIQSFVKRGLRMLYTSESDPKELEDVRAKESLLEGRINSSKAFLKALGPEIYLCTNSWRGLTASWIIAVRVTEQARIVAWMNARQRDFGMRQVEGNLSKWVFGDDSLAPGFSIRLDNSFLYIYPNVLESALFNNKLNETQIRMARDEIYRYMGQKSYFAAWWWAKTKPKHESIFPIVSHPWLWSDFSGGTIDAGNQAMRPLQAFFDGRLMQARAFQVWVDRDILRFRLKADVSGVASN